MRSMPNIGDVVASPHDKFVSLSGKDLFDQLICDGSISPKHNSPKFYINLQKFNNGIELLFANSSVPDLHFDGAFDIDTSSNGEIVYILVNQILFTSINFGKTFTSKLVHCDPIHNRLCCNALGDIVYIATIKDLRDGTHQQKIMKSTNSGESFSIDVLPTIHSVMLPTNISCDLSGDVVAIHRSSNEDNPIIISRDGTETWGVDNFANVESVGIAVSSGGITIFTLQELVADNFTVYISNSGGVLETLGVACNIPNAKTINISDDGSVIQIASFSQIATSLDNCQTWNIEDIFTKFDKSNDAIMEMCHLRGELSLESEPVNHAIHIENNVEGQLENVTISRIGELGDGEYYLPNIQELAPTHPYRIVSDLLLRQVYTVKTLSDYMQVSISSPVNSSTSSPNAVSQAQVFRGYVANDGIDGAIDINIHGNIGSMTSITTKMGGGDPDVIGEIDNAVIFIDGVSVLITEFVDETKIERDYDHSDDTITVTRSIEAFTFELNKEYTDQNAVFKQLNITTSSGKQIYLKAEDATSGIYTGRTWWEWRSDGEFYGEWDSQNRISTINNKDDINYDVDDTQFKVEVVI